MRNTIFPASSGPKKLVDDGMVSSLGNLAPGVNLEDAVNLDQVTKMIAAAIGGAISPFYLRGDNITDGSIRFNWNTAAPDGLKAFIEMRDAGVWTIKAQWSDI